MLKQKFTLWAAMIALALFALPSLAQADLVLNVDLTVTDQVTITALDGLSSAQISGPDTTGFYLENFYAAAGGALNATGGAGDLTSFLNTPDADGGLLFRGGGGTDPGLNVWSYTPDPTSDFLTGVQAFSGSDTWSLDADDYADMLAGATDGDVWFAADDVGDITGKLSTAVVVGQYVVKRPGGAIPEPTSIALLGLGCVGFAFRRRRG